MTCSGSPSLDQHFSLEQEGGITVWQGHAKAFKIRPKSRCFDTLEILKCKRHVNGDGANMKIEIKTNVGGFPGGAPGSSTGRIGNVITQPYSSVPLTFGSSSITIGTELPAINTDYWVVIYSSDYNCRQDLVWDDPDNPPLVTHKRFELSLGVADTNHNRASYGPRDPPDPCIWNYPDDQNDQVNFATYTNTYSASCTQPSCTMTIV